MDINCVDCKVRAIVGMYSRCKVCYLLKKMCGLEKQLLRIKSLYWRALAASTLPPTIPSSDLKNNVKKVDTYKDMQMAYITLAEMVKSGKIDSFHEVSTVVYPDVIVCKFSATLGTYTMYRKVSLPVKTVGEATGIVLMKLISYIDSYDYSYKPDLDYDYDHEDELGRPLYPPKRTEKETEILRKELDRELNEYMGRASGWLDLEKSGKIDYTNPKYFKSLRYKKMVTLTYPEQPKTIELDILDKPEWYKKMYKSMVNSVLKKEIPLELSKKLIRIVDEVKTHLEKPNSTIPTTMELRGIIIEKRDNPEWYCLIYRSILTSVLNKEILYKYFEVLTAILDEAKTELKVKERHERFGLSFNSGIHTFCSKFKKVMPELYEKITKKPDPEPSLVGLEWD